MTKQEQKAIQTAYKDFPLYKAAYKPLKQWENELRQCHITPEETFIEVIKSLEAIRDSATPEFDSAAKWDELFAELYDNNPNSESDTKQATAIIICLLVLYLLQCGSKYNTLSYNLTRQIVKNYGAEGVSAIQKIFLANFALYGDEKLKSAVADYMQSDKSISNEIQNLLANIQITDENATAQIVDCQNRFSIKQILILAQYAFDLSFASNMSNQSAIAEFLSKLTGYGKQSIRTKIPNITAMSQATQREAADLVRELEAIGAKNLANLIKNNIQE